MRGTMNTFKTLLQREWLQHRFGWGLLALLPTAVVLLTMSFGQLQIEEPPDDPRVQAAMTMVAAFAGMGVQLLIVGLTSLIIVNGLARRDHADRSVEFWLSMPVAHAPSFAVPLLTHLVFAPMAALVVGLLGGLAVSLVVIGRIADTASWFALPWGLLLPAALALLARLALGLVLAVVWLSPLILAGVLLTAWLRRWGIVILAVGVGLGSALMDRLFGQPWPWLLLAGLTERAGRSLANAVGGEMSVDSAAELDAAIGTVPAWAANDAMAALSLLASPWLAGALAFSALCFWGLVHWRRGGAGV